MNESTKTVTRIIPGPPTHSTVCEFCDAPKDAGQPCAYCGYVVQEEAR